MTEDVLPAPLLLLLTRSQSWPEYPSRNTDRLRTPRGRTKGRARAILGFSINRSPCKSNTPKGSREIPLPAHPQDAHFLGKRHAPLFGQSSIGAKTKDILNEMSTGHKKRQYKAVDIDMIIQSRTQKKIMNKKSTQVQLHSFHLYS